MVSLLLAAGADADSRDKDGNTALHLAANSGHTRCVELLLLGNAMVDQVSPQGQRALHLAACGGHETVVKALIRKGARLGCTALEVDNGTYCLRVWGYGGGGGAAKRAAEGAGGRPLTLGVYIAPHPQSRQSPISCMYHVEETYSREYATRPVAEP